MRRFFQIGCLCSLTLAHLLCLVSRVAFANDAEASVSRGIQLRKEGHDDRALIEFKKALQVNPTPRTRAQAALAEQALGLWVAAEADLLDALAHAEDAWIKKNTTVLKNALNVIQSHIGTLQVWGTPPGAAIFVNGKPVGVLPLKAPLRVAGESVLLTANADGYLDLQRTVRVPPNQTVRENVELVPIPTNAARVSRGAVGSGVVAPVDSSDRTVISEAPGPESQTETTRNPVSAASDGQTDEPASALRPLAWVAGAGAVGALAFGVVETVLRQRSRDAFNNYAQPNPADPQNPIRDYCNEATLPRECRGLKDAFDRNTKLMVVGYAAAGALAIGSGILFLLSAPNRDTSAAQAGLSCSPTLRTPGLNCRFRF